VALAEITRSWPDVFAEPYPTDAATGSPISSVITSVIDMPIGSAIGTPIGLRQCPIVFPGRLTV
jgi:hypothetical protein